jgi:hypothetical protein
MTALLLGLVVSSNLGAFVDTRRATDELFRTMPKEVAAVAVLEDLDGFLSRIEQAEIVKRLRRTKLVGAFLEQEVVKRWHELDGTIKAHVGVGLESLRKDVFGLSVALAYWPKPAGDKDEAGLLLVRARSPERLQELLQGLFKLQGAEPPRRQHAGISYWTAPDGEKRQYLLTLGPIGLLTDDEDAVQRVIQTYKGDKSWRDEPAFDAMRRGTPDGALVSLFILPRKLDFKLPARTSGKPGEAMLQESVAEIWKSIEWVSLTANVETRLEFGLHASVDRSKLPPQLGSMQPDDGKPIPTQGLPGTIAAFAAGADVGKLSDFIGRLATESNPKDAAAGGRFVRSLFMGTERANELASSVGPRFGAAIVEGVGNLPEAMVALELRASKSNAAVTNAELVEQALRFAALVLTFEANKNGDDQWELKTETIDGARVHVVAGGKNAPPGVEPCFAVHKGWVLAASSPSAMKKVLAESKRPKTQGEFARFDVRAARRAAERLNVSARIPNEQGAMLMEAVADAVPLILFKGTVVESVHHWILELPSPKQGE